LFAFCHYQHLHPVECPAQQKVQWKDEFFHGWLMKGNLARLLPLLHTLVEERAGVRRFPFSHPARHEPAAEFF
jgi:hypothetical protein